MSKSKLKIKYVAAALFVLLLFAGLYLRFLYDVPDAQEVTNMWVSITLIAAGIVGSLVSLIWKERRKPFADDNKRKP